MKEKVNTNKKLRKIIQELAEVAQYLWEKGWAERNAGNISINISGIVTQELSKFDLFPFFELEKTYPELANKYFLVTGTGKRMRDIARKPLKNILLIKLNGEASGYWVVSQKKEDSNNFMPTSELPTHLGIHQMIQQRGSREKVILHTHQNEMIALTQIKENCAEEVINKIIWGMHPEAMVFIPKGLGFVSYTIPGTEEIAQKTIKAFEKKDIVVWEKHGVFAIGESLFETFDCIDIIAKSAQIYFTCKAAGEEPEGLDEEQLNELKELVKKFNTRK